MCGIAGFLGHSDAVSRAGPRAVLRAMGDRIAHRGPDHGDVWFDERGHIGLSHRRLAIVDLSPAGRQPMASASGRLVIAFNGEIYNHGELRAELERAGHAPAWRGHSDTETLLAAIEAWGLEPTLARAVGMFAIALWDLRAQALHLVRDRLGEKPLYVGRAGGALVFGSELKALRAHPDWRGEIDRDALTAYFRLGYVPAPVSIYRDVSKVPPGTVLRVTPADLRAPGLPAPARPYWSLAEAARAGTAAPFRGNDDEAVDELARRLERAVSLQRVADVPLGAFLSGGIDSSTIVATMQAQSSTPVRTFTIGFTEGAYDESAHAEAVARHLGTQHTRLMVTADEALAVIPALPTIYDEPFADPSQIPTACVAALARRHVTVSLSGDGGDELFGGYTRYLGAGPLVSGLAALPAGLRRGVAAALDVVPDGLYDTLARPVAPWIPALRDDLASLKAARFAMMLRAPGPQELYRHRISHWDPAGGLVQGGRETPTAYGGDPRALAEAPSLEQWMMNADSLVYLPDDILTKVDRAAMAVSLETRVPLLDHRIVEFALSLPLRMKIRDGEGKWVLKRLLDRHVPRALFERPKMGFGVPIDAWLRGPLRGWGEALLDPARLRAEGYLDVGQVRRCWEAHQAGVARNGFYLWDVLMFQAWLERERTDAG
jgi:asparagine synthase (glutamine-hydrolysing)